MSDRVAPRVVFTPAEWRAFGLHAVVVAGIAAGLWIVAPTRAGQVAGVIFAVVLLAVPPLVIYGVRRWRR